jgi:hypothetical protein
MTGLIFKRAPIGDNVEDYDVLADGAVVGRIFLATTESPLGTVWMWTLASGQHPTHGTAATREAAMAAFAKSWRRE